jgi:EAL domain-containing protein (putative c-di-GMP-specific phosphodiesterase class I)
MLMKTRLAQLLEQMSGAGTQSTAQVGAFTISSHFQPIYSLSHARVVGHEALLRARGADGKPLSPLEVFASCQGNEELGWCDSLSRLVHMANFVAAEPSQQWLFLNVHMASLQWLMGSGSENSVQEVLAHFQMSGEKLVLEVLESAVEDLSELEEGITRVRSQGVLVAIDDFGAGHSNFDRVWRLKPDIVKLDRSLVAGAARDPRSRRVVTQMVSLLHECGAMVLLEGVETLEEAILAMESDADMVQGYYFGRPQAQLMPSGHRPETLTGLHLGFNLQRSQQRTERRNALAPYMNAIGNAGVLLGAGRSIEEACHGFMELPSTELCYVLDSSGHQVGRPLWSAQRPKNLRLAYEPMNDSDGACWARRPYFRRAMESAGKVQVTRPYRTLNGNHNCVTVSYAFLPQNGQPGEPRVICGDVVWDELQGA